MKNREKVISFILTLMLLFGLVPMGLPGGVDEVYAFPEPPTATFDSTFSSIGGIYQIGTAQELTSFAALVNAGQSTAGLSFKIIGTDISLDGMNWTSIGTSPSAFSGTFDGNGQTISGVTLSTSAALTGVYQGTGFFGFTSGASIQNLNLAGVSISAISCNNVGGLVGYAKNTTLSGATVTGTVAGYSIVGGLVGENDGGTIEDSHTNVVVTGNNYIGGLVGSCDDGNIETSYTNGTVTGDDYVGGLVGDNENSDITDSYATGDVTGEGTSEYAGGLVGDNGYSDITNSYATGAVIGEDLVGGLVGYNLKSRISTSHATGAITGSDYVGGLAGAIDDESNIEKSYANGTVTGNDNVGGLVGVNQNSTIETSYANGSVTGNNSIGGLVGYILIDSNSKADPPYIGTATIETSYATGTVEGKDAVGGLVGVAEYADITSCYAIGAITGTVGAINVGGFVGYNGGTTILGCFWDITTSGITTGAVGNGTGRNTTEMTSDSSIYTGAGWDFTDTWVMGNASISYYYPVFQYAYSLITDDVDTPPATHHHHTVVAAEPVKNLLRFNIGNTDSFITMGSFNEERRLMDVSPILFENRTLLPIRFVVEPLGGTITWNEAEQKVTITRGDIIIELWIGNNVAKVNGIDKVIDPDNPLVKPMIVKPGRTMLPLRFISETLGCTVDWDAVNQEILVSNW